MIAPALEAVKTIGLSDPPQSRRRPFSTLAGERNTVFAGLAAGRRLPRLTLAVRVIAHVYLMKTRSQAVVFADLDGPLLHARSEALEPAREALALLEQKHIPLVLWSGGTQVEIERIRTRLGILHPFIVESGAAAFVPEGYFPFIVSGSIRRMAYRVLEFGRPYTEVTEILHRVADGLGIGIVGFCDMSVLDVAGECGLSMLDARLAKLREYDEPFRIVDGEAPSRDRLVQALRRARLRCVKGARFDHATGVSERGAGIAALRELYRRRYGNVLTVGLGGNLDDLTLLRAVDVPLVVMSQDAGAPARLLRELPNARLSGQEGQAGWARALVGALEAHGFVTGI
jgi:mannosyl-3-phosphoglycerate phosphatase